MTLLYSINLFGTAVFAVTGVLTAVRKKFDPIGVLVISTVTAIGGGTTRDVLLGLHPIAWVRDINILYVIIASVIVSLVAIRFNHVKVSNVLPALLVADAIGLGLFTISGTQVAEQQGVHAFIAIVMGTLTGSAGGVIRDVLANEEPLLFRQTELYATASIAGASFYLLLESLGLSQNIAAIIAMMTVSGLRLAALRYKIKLPIFQLQD